MTDNEEWVMIVWERLNKTGKWCPYSAEVSQLLEQSYRKHLTSACLGDADPKLQRFTVNLTDMIQISDSTGTKCSIRRKTCDDLTTLSQGFIWQWHGDSDEWNTYDIDVNNFIETAYLKGEKTVKLSKHFPGYRYEIDFTRMLQTNKHSKRKRTIRREHNANPYPVEKKTGKVAKVSAAETDSSAINRLLPNLNEEVPGTAALERQVNQYVRNVQNPMDCSPHDEYCSVTSTEQAKHSSLNEKSVDDASNCNGKVKSSAANKVNNTAALVNGKPWMNSWPPDTPEDILKPVPGIDPLPEFKKTKGRKKKLDGAFNAFRDSTSVLSKYTEVVKDVSSFGDETCIICCELLSHGSSYNDDATVVKLSLCSHMFHKACLEAMQKSKPKDMFIQCPTCKKIHGEKCGIQPPGSMVYHVLPYSLPSYSDYETIRIIYDIRSGTQGPEHPNPGKKYTARGFPRHCYLPDNEMGRKVLRLLVKAWNRRLIFTIGTSSTTGEENTVTWNEIHHKTEFGYSRRGHGYPDPNYFENILAELAAHGVVDDEIYEWYPA